MKISEIKVSSLQDLDKACAGLLPLLTGKDLWLLNGQMGAGKTTLAGKIVKSLGGAWSNSPTYAIHQEYRCGNLIVDHLDLYRLKSLEEFEGTGLFDLFLKDQGLILVEWAEKFPLNAFFQKWKPLEIHLSLLSDDSRLMKVNRV
ncbi:MAG: tRNA (adenosine(37)-N6)-threonylcarbamoyltransferase complex ATPase subunit type 1 TsaE [Bdellovibrionales bacterium]|nr:tRNA (adenosine(37)-N6)-threonylcarbamoyltransferase complex ATPase subunit type 1 TsaE [Bdellovibrionales bacterium]